MAKIESPRYMAFSGDKGTPDVTPFEWEGETLPMCKYVMATPTAEFLSLSGMRSVRQNSITWRSAISALRSVVLKPKSPKYPIMGSRGVLTIIVVTRRERQL